MTDRVTVEILRCSDACRSKVEISLSQTLQELKQAISSSSSLGPIDVKYQRLFHLGRELKNGGRSLSTLGVGRFHNFILHLHSTQPKTFDLLDDDEEVGVGRGGGGVLDSHRGTISNSNSNGYRRRNDTTTRAAVSDTIVTSSTSSANTNIGNVNVTNTNNTTVSTKRDRANSIVNLLDSDDDDDDDNHDGDEGEDEPVQGKRRRRKA